MENCFTKTHLKISNIKIFQDKVLIAIYLSHGKNRNLSTIEVIADFILLRIRCCVRDKERQLFSKASLSSKDSFFFKMHVKMIQRLELQPFAHK